MPDRTGYPDSPRFCPAGIVAIEASEHRRQMAECCDWPAPRAAATGPDVHARPQRRSDHDVSHRTSPVPRPATCGRAPGRAVDLSVRRFRCPKPEAPGKSRFLRRSAPPGGECSRARGPSPSDPGNDFLPAHRDSIPRGRAIPGDWPPTPERTVLRMPAHRISSAHPTVTVNKKRSSVRVPASASA